MKNTFKGSILLGLFFLHFHLRAQAPLLPLFENNISAWTTYWYALNSGFCSGGNTNLSYNKVTGDTSVGGQTFKIVEITTHVQTSCTWVVYDSSLGTYLQRNYEYTTRDKKFFRQAEGVFTEINQGGFLDTLMIFNGTCLGCPVIQGFNSKEMAYLDTTYIIKIDSLDDDGKKARMFTLRKPNDPQGYGDIFYMDGIGFAHAGPYTSTSNLTTYEFEGSSFLQCFTNAGKSFGLEWNDANPRKPVGIVLASEACLAPLSLEENKMEEEDVRILLGPNDQLTSSKTALETRVFDTTGNLVLQENESNKLDVSTLTRGIYFAIYLFPNGKSVTYKFLALE